MDKKIWEADEKNNYIQLFSLNAHNKEYGSKSDHVCCDLILHAKTMEEDRYESTLEIYNSAFRFAKSEKEKLNACFRRNEFNWRKGKYLNVALDLYWMQNNLNKELDGYKEIEKAISIVKTESQDENIMKKAEDYWKGERDNCLPQKKSEKNPCLSDGFEVKKITDYGRGIVAKKNVLNQIKIGTEVVNAKAFASVVLHQKNVLQHQNYCITCKKTELYLIPCSNCADVMYCSESCVESNKTHKLYCGTEFHELDDIDAKLSVQLLLEGLIASNVDNFKKFKNFKRYVRRIISESKDVYSSEIRSQQYEIILGLEYGNVKDPFTKFRKAYKCAMNIPYVEKLVNNKKRSKIFLQHLLGHHITCMPHNTFLCNKTFGKDRSLSTMFIYDVLSLFNHSCAPNLMKISGNNHSRFVLVRGFNPGNKLSDANEGQLFISYIGDKFRSNTKKRKKYIKDIWGFDCKCDKCERTDEKQKTKSCESKELLDYKRNHYYTPEIDFECQKLFDIITEKKKTSPKRRQNKENENQQEAGPSEKKKKT